MTDEKHELNTKELDEVAGAMFRPVPDNRVVYTYFTNSRGQTVGRYEDGVLHYRPCPKCGKPMHMGTFGLWYCDPCNERVGNPDSLIWGSTEEMLSNASL